MFPKLEDGSRDIVHDHSHVTTWKSMEKLVGSGKVRAIGVSNYSVKYLEELLPQATVVPAANQIENHPSLPQQEIVDFCKQKGIHITAYSPLGSTGNVLFKAKPIVEVSEKRGVSPASILLSWHSKMIIPPPFLSFSTPQQHNRFPKLRLILSLPQPQLPEDPLSWPSPSTPIVSRPTART